MDRDAPLSHREFPPFTADRIARSMTGGEGCTDRSCAEE
jgi:hypothetical protein